MCCFAAWAASATIVLTCNNHDMFFYNSVLGFMSICNLLAYFTAAENMEQTNRMRGRLSEVREAIGTPAVMKD